MDKPRTITLPHFHEVWMGPNGELCIYGPPRDEPGDYGPPYLELTARTPQSHQSNRLFFKTFDFQYLGPL